MKTLSGQVLSRGLRGLLASGIVAAALVVGSATTASAQINFVGTTAFRFNGAGAYGNSATLAGLTFTNTGFNFTTDNTGYSGFGGNGNGFGTVSLTTQPFTYTGNSIDMLVTFVNPTTANQAFVASLRGTIGASNSGVGITWSTTSITNIPFTNGPGASWYDLDIHNLSVLQNQTTEITGDVQVVPEPASMVLVATGLIGVFGIARRRRSAKV